MLVNSPDSRSVAGSLGRGGLVILPTDTVWGLACVATMGGALERMAELKQRESGQPFAVLAADVATVELQLTGPLSQTAMRLAQRHWPGSLTLVMALGPRHCLSPEVMKWIAPAGFVGVRVPHRRELRDLCASLGGLIAATSANVASQAEPERPEEINAEILAGVDFVWAPPWWRRQSGAASTVVRVTAEGVTLLRVGEIPVESLRMEGWGEP